MSTKYGIFLFFKIHTNEMKTNKAKTKCDEPGTT